MANLGQIVNYDATEAVTIYEDKDGAAVVYVRTIENEDAERLAREQRGKVFVENASAMRKGQNVEGEVLSKMMELAIEPTIELLATSVTGWDLGPHELLDLGVNPECTKENIIKLLSIKWVRDKIRPVAQSFVNFPEA